MAVGFSFQKKKKTLKAYLGEKIQHFTIEL